MDLGTWTFLGLSAVDWVTVLGTALTLSGIGLTLFQVKRTQSAATAAESAAAEALGAMRGGMVLSDVSKCSSSIDEIKSHLRAARYEAALLRLQDLISQLIQIRTASQATQGIDFRTTLTDLSVIRRQLDRQVMRPVSDFDPVKIVESLSHISDEVNEWVGALKFTLPRHNDADSG